MNIKEARISVGLNRRQLSEWLKIPYQTLNQWENNQRKCPEYIETLIVEKILTRKEGENDV